MNNRPRVFVALFLALVATGVGLIWWAPRDPSYQGRLLREWLVDLRSPSEETQKAAREAVTEAGTNAIPVLLEKLGKQDSVLKSNLVSIAQKQNLVKVDVASEADARSQAADGFWALGKKGKAAIPELTKLLADPRSAPHAAWILQQMDDDVIPTLLTATTNRLPAVRRGAVIDLGYRRVAAPGVIPALVRALKDPDASVRDGAAFALGHFPQTTDDTVAALIGALQDGDQRVRSVATQSLAWLGDQAKAAVPALAAIYQDRERSATDVAAAAHALRLIDAEEAAKLGIKPPAPLPSYE